MSLVVVVETILVPGLLEPYALLKLKTTMGGKPTNKHTLENPRNKSFSVTLKTRTNWRIKKNQGICTDMIRTLLFN